MVSHVEYIREGLYHLKYYFTILVHWDLTGLSLALMHYQLIIRISQWRISQLVSFHILGAVLSFWSKDPWMFLNITPGGYVSSVLTHLCSVSIFFLIKHRDCWFGDKNRIWWCLNFFPENILSLPPDAKSGTWIQLIWGEAQTAASSLSKKANGLEKITDYLPVGHPGGPVIKLLQPSDCLSYPNPVLKMGKEK